MNLAATADVEMYTDPECMLDGFTQWHYHHNNHALRETQNEMEYGGIYWKEIGSPTYHDHQKYVLIAKDFDNWAEGYKRKHQAAADYIASHEQLGYIIHDDPIEARKVRDLQASDREWARAGGLFHVFWRRGAIYINRLVFTVSGLLNGVLDPLVSYQIVSLMIGSLSITSILVFGVPNDGKVFSPFGAALLASSLTLATSPSYLYSTAMPMGELAFMFGGGLGSALFVLAYSLSRSRRLHRIFISIASAALMYFAFTSRLDAALIFPGICTLYFVVSTFLKHRNAAVKHANFSEYIKLYPFDIVITCALGMTCFYVAECLYFNYWMTPFNFVDTLGTHARITWPFYPEAQQNHALTIAGISWLPLLLTMFMRATRSRTSLIIAIVGLWPILLILDGLDRGVMREVRFYISTAFLILVALVLANRLSNELADAADLDENGATA